MYGQVSNRQKKTVTFTKLLIVLKPSFKFEGYLFCNKSDGCIIFGCEFALTSVSPLTNAALYSSACARLLSFVLHLLHEISCTFFPFF